MSFCFYIESYRDTEGNRVSVFHRDNFLYELTSQVKHVLWFTDMSLDQVRQWMCDHGYTLETT
jgi:hypothetical protein